MSFESSGQANRLKGAPKEEILRVLPQKASSQKEDALGVIIKASGRKEGDDNTGKQPTDPEQERPIGKVIPARRYNVGGTDNHRPPVTHHKGGLRRPRH